MSGSATVVRHFPHQDASLPFSAAVRVGDIVYLSGQIGVDAQGVLADTIAEQTHAALRNLAEAADMAGTSLDHVFKVTVMLSDMALWPDVNRAYRDWFDPARLPARSAFGTSGLAFGALVEIEAMAVAGGLER